MKKKMGKMGKNMLIAAFPEVGAIGKKVAHALKAEYTKIYVKDFPDSEFHLKLKRNPKGKTVVIINSITKDPDEKIVETVLAEGIARDYKAKKVILVATYLPYMRQDTHFMNYDSFSAKHMLEIFAGFDKIIAVDPHLHRIKKMHYLSHKAESITADGVVADYIKKNFRREFEIIGPDEESRQWSVRIAHMLKKKVFILQKERIGDKKIRQKVAKLGSGKDYIIIDDIISTGHTLVGALKMAKSQGAKKLTCIGIHGLLVDNCD
ncbi:MAG: ribose-phosphate diphosphokinase, partial [Nanoarchaeota archaeon]